MKNKILSMLEVDTNLTYNENKNILYGTYKNYYTYIQAFPAVILINLPVQLSEAYTNKELNLLLTKLTKDYSNIQSAAYNNNSIQIRFEYKTIWKSNSDKILEILNTLIEEVSMNSLRTCCPCCGEIAEITPFLINDMLIPCCDSCKIETKNSIANARESVKQIKSNVIGGIIGAFLGSLIGVALWIVVAQLGYISSLCGAVLTVCTIKGYQLFGGKLDKKGIFLTIVITILMVFVSAYLSFGLDIYNAYKLDANITIFDAIKSVPDFLEYPEASRAFFIDLGLGYLFTLLCAVSQFKHSYKEANYRYKAEEI